MENKTTIYRNVSMIVIAMMMQVSCQNNEETVAQESLKTVITSSINNDTYHDGKVDCVMMIKLETQNLTEKHVLNEKMIKDSQYNQKMSLLTEYEYGPVVKERRGDAPNGPSIYYNIVPSFKSCGETKTYLSQLHKKTYNVEAEFLKSSLTEYVSYTSQPSHTPYHDENVHCVIMIRTGRRYFSGNKVEHDKQRDVDYRYDQKMSALNDHEYPPIGRTIRAGYADRPAMIYNVIPSFKPCEETREYLIKLHFETYNTQAEFLGSSLAEYVSIVRGE